MQRRSLLLAAAVAAIALSAAPAMAQTDGSTVSFDGVGFTFDPSIGVSANVTTVPGQKKTLQVPTGPDAPHVVFSLYGPRPTGGKVPPVGFTNSTVTVYRTADLAGYDQIGAQVTALQQLLAERPDPATLMVPVPPASGPTTELPFLPVAEAGQVARAKVQYVDMPGLSGVTYLTGFRQDVSPLTRNDLWYTFQGLSTDGSTYVSATFILTTDLLPKSYTPKQMNQIGKNAKSWNAYLTETVAKLNAADPSAFSPSLTSADALIASITLEGVPAQEPGPLTSPAPSASPAA